MFHGPDCDSSFVARDWALAHLVVKSVLLVGWRSIATVRMSTIDVECPPGVGAGELIAITWGNSTFNVECPAGIAAGEIFTVALPDDMDAEPPSLPVLGVVVASVEAQGGDGSDGSQVLEAALKAVIDAIEDHNDPDLDELVDGSCADFADFDGEAKLEWTPMYERYVELLEDLVTQTLDSLACSPRDVFAYAQTYSPSDERSQKLIAKLLAMADFTSFCVMMRDRHEILQMFG